MNLTLVNHCLNQKLINYFDHVVNKQIAICSHFIISYILGIQNKSIRGIDYMGASDSTIIEKVLCAGEEQKNHKTYSQVHLTIK